MEWLKRLGEPILERIRAWHSPARSIGIGLGAIVAVGLWLLIGRQAPTDYVSLLDGREFSEPQMARISSAFRKHRLEAARIAGRNIQIPRAQQDIYLMALDAENAWPAEFNAPIERALAGTNPLMPWQQSRENLQLGEKQMLARIVAEMSGIENAAVQYDEVRHPGFPPRVECRAVVAVKAVGQRQLELEEVEAIRDTVVAFKSGLDRENVTITDLNACRAYPGTRAPDASHAAARALAAAKRTVEDEWRAKIEERLRMYPDLTVVVNAHFAPASASDRTDGGTIAQSTPPMQLVQVSASIDVPKSYFLSVWRQRRGGMHHQFPQAVELQAIDQEICGTIERAVSAILPPPAPGWQTPHQVAVTSHDDLPTTTLPTQAAPASPWTPWLSSHDNASYLAATATAALSAAAIAAVCYRRRRTRRRTESSAHDPLCVADSAREAAPSLRVFAAELPRSHTELQQQLAERVSKDPAAAAEILKQWLSKAA